MNWRPTGRGGVQTPVDIRTRSDPRAGNDDQGRPAMAPGAVGRGARVQALFPPHIFPPFNATPFFAADNATVTIGPASTKFTGTQAKITIPQGNVGVIRELTFYVNGLLATSVIQFQVLENGNPIEGYAGILMPQLVAVNFSYSPDNVFATIGEGAAVEVRVSVTDVVAYALGFSLRGWSYTKEIAGWWSGVVG